MKGFLITKSCAAAETGLDEPKKLTWADWKFSYSPLDKFENDRLFFADEDKIVLLDGVIYNKNEIIASGSFSDWKQAFQSVYAAAPESFMLELRGSFCGAILNKRNGSLMAFVNQSGEKPLYYCSDGEFSVLASHNNLLLPVLKGRGKAIAPDEEGCIELLTLGYCLHGNTPFKDVSRLMAGKRLTIDAAGCRESRYHMFRNIPEHELGLDECVNEADIRFRRAVSRIFEKNREYGYQGECDLSGGLDSRLVTWVAHDLGFENVLNVCYCESGGIDHTTSKKIAEDIKNEYLFYPMDGGQFLMDIDEVVDRFGGQLSYIVCTGANRVMKEVAKKNIGLTATGLLGELHNAYWTEGEVHTPPALTKNRYCSRVDFQLPESYKADYDNYEQMNLYEFSNLMFLSSAIVRQQRFEVASPFIDVDFLEFAYRIPLKYRKEYLFTKTWMVNKYLQAAKYVWQTKRMPVDKSYYNNFYLPKAVDDARNIVIRLINKAARVVNLSYQISLRAEMNPFEKWYRVNPDLRAFIENYYAENICLVMQPQLLEAVRKAYSGDVRDKLQAINLLAVYKRYFNGQAEESC